MTWNISRALAIAPHADDVEFGAGGFIHKLAQQGVEIHEVIFSLAKISLPEGFAEDILITESKAAAGMLGIKPENLEVHDYPVRYFPEHRQEILEILIRLRREIQPDLVLVHSSTDVHQDHHTVYEEGVRAFRSVTLLGYLMPWNTIRMNHDLVVKLTNENIDAKISAVATYHSQRHRPYSQPDFLRGWARTYGIMVGTEFAETFEVIRWVID